MNIGKEKRVIRVEPATVPVPQRERTPQRAPDEPRRREAPPRHEPAETPAEPVKVPEKAT